MSQLKNVMDEKCKLQLNDMANQLRLHSLKMTSAACSGHPTSCSSMAEIMAVLFFRQMRYTVAEPKDPSNDRFVLSKGHAAPILYAAWAEAGLFPREKLLELRKLGSDLEGHPTPRLNFIDVATGSLGQGISVAAGMAYCGKYIDKASYRVFCLLGDGESFEGSVWEAFNFASFYKLDNMVAIIDVNRLGQSAQTPLGHDMEQYKKRLESFGFHAIVVEGHDVEALSAAFDEAAATRDVPSCIIARTYKGYNFPLIADQENWHGKALSGENFDRVSKHLESLIKEPTTETWKMIPKPSGVEHAVDIANVCLSEPPNYVLGESLATRQAYGNALTKLARNNPRVYALDGDMKNSTFSINLMNVFPDKYIECFICEQNLIGVSIGLTCRDRTIAFASTFACFLTRAFDHLRMGVISQTNINVIGSHCGVSIGEDGPSQMALEDLAMFRSLPGATVFYPSDAVSTERAVELAAKTRGICYIRVSRPSTKIIYKNEEIFKIGHAKVVRKSQKDEVLIISSCITLEAAMVAADQLVSSGVNVRIIDPFTIKPMDKTAVIKNARECNGKIITVEDHYPEGGLGDAVLDVISEEVGIILRKLAVREVPRSGPPLVLLEKYGIGVEAIKKAVLDFIK